MAAPLQLTYGLHGLLDAQNLLGLDYLLSEFGMTLQRSWLECVRNEDSHIMQTILQIAQGLRR